MFDKEVQITEGVLGWECFSTKYCKYLTTNGEWVDNPIHTEDQSTSFDSREQIEKLLDEQADDEDQDYYTDFVLGAATDYRA